MLLGAAPAAGAAESWGRTLVRTHIVPRDEIAQFNAFRMKAREPNQSTLENILAQDSVAWSMPPLDVVQKDNPYRIVIRVEAEVTGPDATSLFLAGWTRLDQHGDPDGPTAMGTVAGLGGPGEAAGGGAPRLVKTAAAGPVSFKADGRVVPSIELSRKQGLTVRARRGRDLVRPAGDDVARAVLRLAVGADRPHDAGAVVPLVPEARLT